MIRATVNLLTILYACAAARLPWDGGPGWDPSWEPFLPLCEGSYGERTKYVLCCGHTLTPAFAQKLIDADVMKHGGPDRFGRSTIIIGAAGRELLAKNFGRLKAEYPETPALDAQG